MFEERWAAQDDTPEDEDWDLADEDRTAPCLYCGEQMLEDAPQCPACGKYISAEDLPPQQKPSWVIVGVVLCLIVMLVWLAGV
jgi:hypothetical protein